MTAQFEQLLHPPPQVAAASNLNGAVLQKEGRREGGKGGREGRRERKKEGGKDGKKERGIFHILSDLQGRLFLVPWVKEMVSLMDFAL